MVSHLGPAQQERCCKLLRQSQFSALGWSRLVSTGAGQSRRACSSWQWGDTCSCGQVRMVHTPRAAQPAPALHLAATLACTKTTLDKEQIPKGSTHCQAFSCRGVTRVMSHSGCQTCICWAGAESSSSDRPGAVTLTALVLIASAKVLEEALAQPLMHSTVGDPALEPMAAVAVFTPTVLSAVLLAFWATAGWPQRAVASPELGQWWPVALSCASTLGALRKQPCANIKRALRGQK
jgi:hypothetical protein